MPEDQSGDKRRIRYRYITWAVIGACLAAWLATLDYNGPFFDEGIYVTAGIRSLEGLAYTDRFLTWFGGSLAWPILAGVGFRVGGLIGTRAVAALVTVVGLGAFAQAVRNVFGERASFWATLALALNGAFLSLARLGVYDTLALSAIAVSLWAITELDRRDHRGWLFVSAVAYTVAVLAKYPMGVMALPLLGTLVILRKERVSTDVLLFAFIAGALGLSVFLPLREPVADFFSFRLQQRPDFGVPVRLIAITIVYLSLIPFILAVAGWVMVSGKRRLATLMVLSLAIWPTYHLATGDPVSTSKHLVFGYVFAYPLAGVTLSRIWGDGRAALLRRGLVLVGVVVLGGIGILQATQADRSWPDLRPPAAYLVDHVQPGDQLLINESWPYTMYLYTAGRIESPWDVYDEYRITHEEAAPAVCEYDWFVDTRGSFAWPDEILDRKAECGSYEQVFSSTSYVINLGADATYVSQPVDSIVWKNTGE